MPTQLESKKKNICGTKIRSLRLNWGERNNSDFSQNDLAASLQLRGCNLTKNMVQEIESGHRAIRDYELKAIADFFEVTTDELFTPLD